MRFRHAVLSLFIVSVASWPAFSTETISGAFGIRFGEPITKYETTLEMLGTMWGIVPPEPNSYFPMVSPDTYMALTTPDGIVVGVVATKREKPDKCRAYRQDLMGYLSSKYGEARRFEGEPGYGDRFVIVQDQRIIEVICNDKLEILTVEFYSKPNFTSYGLDALEYDMKELFPGERTIDITGF